MCRWLTYNGPPIYLEKLLFEPEHSLIQQSLHARKARVATQGDGFGIGWYGERALPGTYHETLPAWNDRNLRSISHQIRSGLFFAHVRASTGTATSRANCHPFSHGRWLFMHNGQIGGYDLVRRRLEALIPDELYPHRQGTTDSEAIFYLLFRNGLEDDPSAALGKTLDQIREIMARARIDEALRFTAVLSDGQHLFATRYATDENPPSLFWCERDGRVIVVSEPLDTNKAHWNQVPADHRLVARDGRVLAVEPMTFAAEVAVG